MADVLGSLMFTFPVFHEKRSTSDLTLSGCVCKTAYNFHRQTRSVSSALAKLPREAYQTVPVKLHCYL